MTLTHDEALALWAHRRMADKNRLLADDARQVEAACENLDASNAKQAEVQEAQAMVLRKARELDDARRELELSVERRVQDAIATVCSQADMDASKLKSLKRKSKSPACYARSKTCAAKQSRARSSYRVKRKRLRLKLLASDGHRPRWNWRTAPKSRTDRVPKRGTLTKSLRRLVCVHKTNLG